MRNRARRMNRFSPYFLEVASCSSSAQTWAWMPNLKKTLSLTFMITCAPAGTATMRAAAISNAANTVDRITRCAIPYYLPFSKLNAVEEHPTATSSGKPGASMSGKMGRGKTAYVKPSHLAEDRPAWFSDGPCRFPPRFLFAKGSSSRCGETTSRRWQDLTHTIEELHAGRQKNKIQTQAAGIIRWSSSL